MSATAEDRRYGAYFTLHTIWDQRGTPDLSVQYELAGLWSRPHRRARQGRTVAFADALTHPLTQGEAVAAYTATDTRALIIVPLIKDGPLRGVVLCNATRAPFWTEEERTLTEEVANRIWAAVERARSEEALRTSEAQLPRELEDTKKLQAISRLFIEEENIDSLYEQLLTAAMAFMGAACGSIQMLDEERQKLRLLAWKGFHPEAAAYWQTVDFGAGTVSAAAFRSGERVIVPDVRTSDLLVGSDSHQYYELSGIVAVQSTPLISRSGRLVGLIATHWREPHEPHERELRLLDVLARQAADVLERKLAEAALRQAQESLELASSAARMGIWDLDLKTYKARTNLRHDQIYGYSESLLEWGPDSLRQHVLPEDLATLEAALAQVMELGSPPEVRVRRLDGQVRWISSQGRAYYDEAAGPRFRRCNPRHHGTQASRGAAAGEERFRRYFRTRPDRQAISSPTQGMVEVNDELCRIFGYTRSELLQMSWAELTHPDDLSGNVAQFKRVMAGEIEGYVLDKRCIRKDGQVIDTILSVKCLRRVNDAFDYMVALVQDITERKQAEENQAHLLQKVEHSALLPHVEQTLARSQEHGQQGLARNLHDLVGQNLTALNLNEADSNSTGQNANGQPGGRQARRHASWWNK
jgi:PAS domain S-box-containing protein